MVGHLLVALVIALIMAAIFGPLLGRPGPLGAFWATFLILFLATWAGGVWMGPVGPPMFGVSWVPFLWVALIIALILAVATPPERRRTAVTPAGEPIGTTDAFFWVLMVLLAIAAFAAYT